MANVIELRPIKIGELRSLLLLKPLEEIRELTDEQGKRIEASYARSLFVDGELMLCGGVSEHWVNRGEAWAVLHPEAPRKLKSVIQGVRTFLSEAPYNRIEAAIESQDMKGHRWIRALGFELEAMDLKHFLPSGKSAHLYARFKQGA